MGAMKCAHSTSIIESFVFFKTRSNKNYYNIFQNNVNRLLTKDFSAYINKKTN